MRDDIPFDQLLDLVEGRLAEPEASALRPRLGEGDSERTARWLEWFRAASAGIRFAEPSPAVLDRLYAMMPARPGLLARLAGSGRLLTARLVDEHAGGPMLAGARGADVEQARQLYFEADDGTDVVVRIAEHLDGSVQVDGQVLAETPQRTVILIAGGAEVATLRCDDHGEFELSLPADVVRRAGESETALLVDSADAFLRIDLGTHLGRGTREDRT